jgi:hypothetical protein
MEKNVPESSLRPESTEWSNKLYEWTETAAKTGLELIKKRLGSLLEELRVEILRILMTNFNHVSLIDNFPFFIIRSFGFSWLRQFSLFC